MSNPFMTDNDEFYAEAYNGAIALFALSNPQILLDLPGDYDEAAFLEGLNKCKFVLVNLILFNTEISGNKIQLVTGQTTGTATFRVYPNIEPFKEWKEVRWMDTKTTGTITCDVKKDEGSTMVNDNISNPEDLSDESMGLEYVDFVFTLTEVSSDRPTLDGISLIITGGQ